MSITVTDINGQMDLVWCETPCEIIEYISHWIRGLQPVQYYFLYKNYLFWYALPLLDVLDIMLGISCRIEYKNYDGKNCYLKNKTFITIKNEFKHNRFLSLFFPAHLSLTLALNFYLLLLHTFSFDKTNHVSVKYCVGRQARLTF